MSLLIVADAMDIVASKVSCYSCLCDVRERFVGYSVVEILVSALLSAVRLASMS